MVSNITALRLMRELFNKHGLTEFNPQIVNLRGAVIGICKYNSKLIGIDQQWLRRTNIQEFTQVILHEIAHELDYRWFGQRGHGETFIKTCKIIGCVFDKPIIHCMKPQEKGILVIVGTIIRKVREVPMTFEVMHQNMKVISQSEWDLISKLQNGK